MRKYFFVICLLVLMLVLPSCKSPNSPEVPGFNYYDYKFTYQRPAGSIVNTDGFDPSIAFIEIWYGNKSYERTVHFVKQNDLFIGEISNVGVPAKCDIIISDTKRWRETYRDANGSTWGNPHTVGDIITMECKQTGFKKQLRVVNNQYVSSSLPPNFEAKMGTANLKEDGSFD